MPLAVLLPSPMQGLVYMIDGGSGLSDGVVL